MTEWVLIVAFWAGALAKGDAVSLATAPGFKSKAACEAAGADVVKKFGTMMKSVEFVCAATVKA